MGKICVFIDNWWREWSDRKSQPTIPRVCPDGVPPTPVMLMVDDSRCNLRWRTSWSEMNDSSDPVSISIRTLFKDPLLSARCANPVANSTAARDDPVAAPVNAASSHCGVSEEDDGPCLPVVEVPDGPAEFDPFPYLLHPTWIIVWCFRSHSLHLAAVWQDPTLCFPRQLKQSRSFDTTSRRASFVI